MYEVDFGKWGVQALPPGQETTWWYTWIFDGDHFVEVSALPTSWSPANGAIQVVAQVRTPGTVHVTWRNPGTDYVYWTPTFTVAPGRY